MYTISTHEERLLSGYVRACLDFEFRSTTKGTHHCPNALDIIQYHWIMFPSDFVMVPWLLSPVRRTLRSLAVDNVSNGAAQMQLSTPVHVKPL